MEGSSNFNFSQSLLMNDNSAANGARRKKLVSGGGSKNPGGLKIGTNASSVVGQLSKHQPLIITSPLNRSKQDVFSLTGKINPSAQLESDMIMPLDGGEVNNSKAMESFKS